MTKKYQLQGLDCANCAAKIERGVKAIDGVISASVNFMTAKMTIEADEDRLPAIEAEAEKIVKRVEPDTKMRTL